MKHRKRKPKYTQRKRETNVNCSQKHSHCANIWREHIWYRYEWDVWERVCRTKITTIHTFVCTIDLKWARAIGLHIHLTFYRLNTLSLCLDSSVLLDDGCVWIFAVVYNHRIVQNWMERVEFMMRNFEVAIDLWTKKCQFVIISHQYWILPRRFLTSSDILNAYIKILCQLLKQYYWENKGSIVYIYTTQNRSMVANSMRKNAL